MWEVGISVLRDNKTAEFIKLFIGILIKRDFFHSYLLYLEDFLLDIQKFMKILFYCRFLRDYSAKVARNLSKLNLIARLYGFLSVFYFQIELDCSFSILAKILRS